MPYNFTFSLNDIIYLIIVIVIGLICFKMITSGSSNNKVKQPKGFKKYKYRKNERQLQNEAAAKRWKQKTKSYRDTGMISNEPLDYEKAKNLKYHDYIQAQWDELNK